MLDYLKDHRRKVYPLLESKGERIRKGLKEALDRVGLNAVVTGTGSLFQTHFPFEKGTTLNSPQSIHQLTDLEKRENEFRVRMLAKGIHVMHGGGCLSLAHSDEDIEKIVKAARKVGGEMVDSVRSSKF
jgi:glutamate-1-semialdehyde 2,1-aminomutase